jgi:3-oxoacyl-[acyl-carrier protein] reductase
MHNELTGKVALVTGGSRGVGAAVARRLAEAGADVAFSYVNSKEKANALVDELRALGVRTSAYRADHADDAAVARLVDEVAADFGRLDVLVNNAGVFVTGGLADPDRDETVFAHQFAVNVTSAVTVTRSAAKHLGDGGRIILISSVGVNRTTGPYGDYAAGKAALETYGRTWSHEFGPRGITVNTVQLGQIETDMLILAPDEAALSAIPMRRFGKPEEVAEAVAYLAGPAAGFVTGANLRIDGGFSA